MKNLILPALLILLSSCGRESGSSVTTEQKDPSRQESRTCGYESSLMNSLCIPLADYIINSQKPFPDKMKIIVTRDKQKLEYINECTAGSGPDFKVERKTDSGQLIFAAHRALFYEGIEMEIVDMGQRCDNDAIFFSGTIRPVVQIVKDDRDRAIIDLQN